MNGYTPRRRPGLTLSLMLVGCAAGGLLGVIATAFVRSGELASGALGIGGAGLGVIIGGLVAIRIEDRRQS